MQMTLGHSAFRSGIRSVGCFKAYSVSALEDELQLVRLSRSPDMTGYLVNAKASRQLPRNVFAELSPLDYAFLSTRRIFDAQQRILDHYN